MSRQLDNNNVTSSALDDPHDVYVPPSPLTAVTNDTQQAIQHTIISTIETNDLIPTQEQISLQLEQQIHTISSSDDDDEKFVQEQCSIKEEINISSDDNEGFEGFDEITIPNSGGLINNTSQEDLNISRNNLKRHYLIDNNEYLENSDIVEAIEVDDDEEIVDEIGDDGKTICRSIELGSPKKLKTHQNESHTPNKRKKDENDTLNAISPKSLKTTADQIVEVNSDSTTNSLKQKRQEINTKFQLSLSQQQQQNHKLNNNPNKCSTESSSEFPVSSPSNPQQPRGGKYPPRPPLLKNTLPADSFERQLAILSACNPQMTLSEKIQSWECNEELSDVEDVYKFDEEFKKFDKQRQILEDYDYAIFRKIILGELQEQKNQSLNTNIGGVSGFKCIASSGSESSKSVIHVNDRPTTSAGAQLQLQQRRSKPQMNLETGEPKKRLIKEAPKRNQNSTTPPQTSSSDNEKDFFQNTTNLNALNTLKTHQIQLHDKLLCPSSSEEAISQDVPTHVKLKANIASEKPKSSPPSAKSNDTITIASKSPRVVTEEEIDSVFRLHRLSRERDKYNKSPSNGAEAEQPSSIIQMRLDFNNEAKREQLNEKKLQLFKTPIIPQKYLANLTLAEEKKTSLSPTKTLTTNEGIKKEANSTKIEKPIKDEITIPDKTVNGNTDSIDLDGVYHQQHEFCNYLGLTGMSTATAMANAVAELAQCNLARRSMRVFRQQQQERREKSAKEERQLEALKLKQTKDVQKSEKSCCDSNDMIKKELTITKSDEGSFSQSSEPTTSPFKQPKNKTMNNSSSKSLKKSQNCIIIEKKEPEIKILCHIATKNNEEAEKLSKKCIKEITQPIRGTIMRQVKQRKTEDKPTNINDSSGNKKENKNENIRDIKIEKENKTDCNEEIIDKDINLKSPKLHDRETYFKVSQSIPKILNKTKEIVQNNEMPSIAQTSETTSGLISLGTSKVAKSTSSCLKANNFNKDKISEQHKTVELNLVKPDIHLIASAEPSIIQQKLQMALNESRKSKPSIFIVQSFECKKEQTKSLDNLHSKSNLTAVSEVQKEKSETKRNIKKPLKVLPKYNKTHTIKKARKKGKNYPTTKRQLRKRQIIVIKSLKTKKKSYTCLSEFKRELRSSPKTNVTEKHNNQVSKTDALMEKEMEVPTKTTNCSETKSYRTVHTETKDLEIYLDKHKSQSKIPLTAKASALLDRSRRKAKFSKLKLTPKRESNTSNINLHETRTHILRPKLQNAPTATATKKRSFKTSTKLLKSSDPDEINNLNKSTEQPLQPTINIMETENVVVSSTTNTYDERPSIEPLAIPSPVTLRSLHNTVSYVIASSPIKTKDQFTQYSTSDIINRRSDIQYINTSPLPTQTMRNPLKPEHGSVYYIYYELDILIVIQERLVSFWKCSKLINILSLSGSKFVSCANQQTSQQSETLAHTPKQNIAENCCNNQQLRQGFGEWTQLGELRRLNCDFEISVPYGNRICLHNSIPIYLEMRGQELPKNQRDCNLLSIYINIYYYHDEDMIAKCTTIPLDSIQSDINSVIYTTLIDSRYFIMTWPQENHLGKPRSGLCKYSLTPQLDTLASIREFKSMRHAIYNLECMSDDKLIGFGDTQVTVWDHRSGDVLMNFDLEIPLGRHLGSTYFSSEDIEQNNILILQQYRKFHNDSPAELMTLACTVTHVQPSYRILQEINLPMPAFNAIKSAINTGDHLVVTGQNDDELWISSTNPRLITVIKHTIENSKRYYNRQRSQLIELTEKTLNVNTVTNQILQLTANLALN